MLMKPQREKQPTIDLNIRKTAVASYIYLFKHNSQVNILILYDILN